MPLFSIILVEPQIEGNIGAVARAMKNFGLDELILYKSVELNDEAYKRAKHAGDILRNARRTDNFEDALKGFDYIVGTSGIDSKNEKEFLRLSITPRAFAEKIEEYDGKVAILFGREDYGLYIEELQRCDLLVTIPTNDKYPILNLSHAVAVVLYELYIHDFEKILPRESSEMEKDLLYDTFDAVLDATNYPEYKKEKTRIMFRKLIGKATPSKWEYHTLMGVLARAVKTIEMEREKK